MGKIAAFIPYQELMIKMRYLSKNWLLFTQKYLQYIDNWKMSIWQGETRYIKSARLKVCIDRVYSGVDVVPILWHPYYTEADEVTFSYEVSIKDTYETSSLTEKDLLDVAGYFHIFFADLFKLGNIFSKVQKLTIYWTSGFYIKMPKYSLNHFKHLVEWEVLQNLEELVVKDHCDFIDNSTFQKIERLLFPKLKNLSLPVFASNYWLTAEFEDRRKRLFNDCWIQAACPSKIITERTSLSELQSNIFSWFKG